MAQSNRLREALDRLGSPLPKRTRAALERAARETDPARQAESIEAALDPFCLLSVVINPESRVRVAHGLARPELVQGGWRAFLVKVRNQAGVTAVLRAASPNESALTPDPGADRRDRWLGLSLFKSAGFPPQLSGAGLEYRILRLYSRDAGKREAKLLFDVGQGTQDIGFRNEANLLFDCAPTSDVTFRIRDAIDRPTTARFVIRDDKGRVYPAPFDRQALNPAFRPRVSLTEGKTVKLPKGIFTFEYAPGRGYPIRTRTVSITGKPQVLAFRL